MIKVMVRPKWLVALAVVLVVAAAFAALAQWQIESAIRSAQHASQPPLGPTTLGDAATPQSGLMETSVGRSVSFEGVLDPRDIEVIADRLQGEELGYWVIGHVYVTNDGVSAFDGVPRASYAPGLAVALGWAPNLDEANAAADAIRATTPPAAQATPRAFDGRLEFGQAPQLPASAGDPHALEQMSPAYLVNRWAEPGPQTYDAYVILDLEAGERAGLAPIIPLRAEIGPGLNMLNVFYAIEWVVFIVFAFYVWWRLVRAEYENERAATFHHLNPDERAERDIRLEVLRRHRGERDAAAPRHGKRGAAPSGRGGRS